MLNARQIGLIVVSNFVKTWGPYFDCVGIALI